MALSENRSTVIEEGEHSAEVRLAQSREGRGYGANPDNLGQPLMSLQVYGPDYEETGEHLQFWFDKAKARELMNHLRAFLGTS